MQQKINREIHENTLKVAVFYLTTFSTAEFIKLPTATWAKDGRQILPRFFQQRQNSFTCRKYTTLNQ